MCRQEKKVQEERRPKTWVPGNIHMKRVTLWSVVAMDLTKLGNPYKLSMIWIANKIRIHKIEKQHLPDLKSTEWRREVEGNNSGQLKLYIFWNVHVCPTIKYFPTSRSHTETTNGSGRSCPIQPWSLLSDWMSASILSYVKRVRRIVISRRNGIKGIHRK